jgi:chromosome partitioning protein
MIYTVGGIKGGTGKTTIAVNLVVELSKRYKKDKILLIDGDPQETASEFTEWRRETLNGEIGYEAIKLTGEAIFQKIKLLKEQYKYIVIDVGGRDTDGQRAALFVCDVFLLPFPPRPLDFWSVPPIQAVLDEIRTQKDRFVALSFLNRADVRSPNNRTAEAELQATGGIVFIDSPIRDRVAFANAAGSGLCVTEMKYPDRKAVREMNNLLNQIFTYKPAKK